MRTAPVRVLLLEDNEADARLALAMLADDGIELSAVRVESEVDYRAGLAGAPDVILSDFSLPRFGAARALEVLREVGLDIPFIILSGTIGEETAVRMMRQGATDYVLKDRMTRLPDAVRGALVAARDRRELVGVERRLHNLVRRTPIGLATTTPDGIFLAANPAMLRILGVESFDALSGLTFFSFFYDPEEPTRLLREAAARGGLGDRLLRLRRADGAERWVSSSVALDFANDEATLDLAIVDQTTRREAEEHLREALERASESDRLKSAFLANVSHEVRTPLNVMLGFTSLIADSIDDDGTVRQMAEKVERAGRRLVTTVQSILDFSRVEAGAFELYPAEVDPVAIAAQVIADHRRAADEKALEIRLEVEARDVRLRFDEYCFARVMDIIVDNAIKFTERGEVVVRSVRGQDGRFCVEVRDTGLGIEEAYLGKLFHPFRQEQGGIERRFEGSGLGLALARRLIELNGATISVSSRKHEGSRFTIECPREIEVRPSVRPVPVKPEAAADFGPRDVVLVVEDDYATQLFMRTLLSRRFNVEVVTDAGSARAFLGERSARICAVLMDLSLGGAEDGIMLTQWIRAEPDLARIPVIATTAHASSSDRHLALEAGCDDFLAKPLDRSRLLQVVERAVAAGTAADRPRAS